MNKNVYIILLFLFQNSFCSDGHTIGFKEFSQNNLDSVSFLSIVCSESKQILFQDDPIDRFSPAREFQEDDQGMLYSHSITYPSDTGESLGQDDIKRLSMLSKFTQPNHDSIYFNSIDPRWHPIRQIVERAKVYHPIHEIMDQIYLKRTYPENTQEHIHRVSHPCEDETIFMIDMAVKLLYCFKLDHQATIDQIYSVEDRYLNTNDISDEDRKLVRRGTEILMAMHHRNSLPYQVDESVMNRFIEKFDEKLCEKIDKELSIEKNLQTLDDALLAKWSKYVGESSSNSSSGSSEYLKESSSNSSVDSSDSEE